MATANGRLDMVLTRAPLRISFSGGGTDFPEFYRAETGAVLSMAIDRYIYVTLKRHSPLFEERYRLNYFDSEHVNELSEIRNHIIRECLRLVPVEPPVYVSVVSDVPAASGLGSSGTFGVALLQALHALRGETVSPVALAREAARVEIDVLARPVGIQDHVAAAFGGLNLFRFHRDDSITLEPHAAGSPGAQQLFSHVMLFWTGMTRDSSSVLAEQSARTTHNLDALRAIRDTALRMNGMLGACPDGHVRPGGSVPGGGLDIAGFAALLDAAWRAKKALASGITTPRIDAWYEQARHAGALGGKLCGAGGGGFLMFIVPPEHQAAVTAALDIPLIPVSCAPLGSEVIFRA
jgi:D-glycero-alpha-D-manno-heptose-7-phosphate kinase